MLKYLHRTALSLYSNYVPCIIHNNSSSIRKTTKIPHFEDQNPQIPSYADTSFTNIIYTKSSTLPSSKIFRIMHTSSTLSNKICNLPWLGAAATAKLSISLFEDSFRAKSPAFWRNQLKKGLYRIVRYKPLNGPIPWLLTKPLVRQNSVVLEIDRAVLIQVFLNPERRCYLLASPRTSASDKARS